MNEITDQDVARNPPDWGDREHKLFGRGWFLTLLTGNLNSLNFLDWLLQSASPIVTAIREFFFLPGRCGAVVSAGAIVTGAIGSCSASSVWAIGVSTSATGETAAFSASASALASVS